MTRLSALDVMHKEKHNTRENQRSCHPPLDFIVKSSGFIWSLEAAALAKSYRVNLMYLLKDRESGSNPVKHL